MIIFNYGNIFGFRKEEAHGVGDNTECWTCVFKLSFEIVWFPNAWLLHTNMLQGNQKIQIVVTIFLFLSITLCFCNILISHSTFKHEFKCKSSYKILALHTDEDSSAIKWPELSGWAGLVYNFQLSTYTVWCICLEFQCTAESLRRIFSSSPLSWLQQ